MKKLYITILLAIASISLVYAYQYKGLGITQEERLGINYVNTDITVRTIYDAHIGDRYYPYTPKIYDTYGSQTNGRKPRRITVYDGNGNSRETPGGNGDNPNWLYKYDEINGIWYCSKDGGETWYEYRSTSGFTEWFISLILGEPTGATWRSIANPINEDNISRWHNDPADPFLQPINTKHVFLFMTLLSCVYMHYKTKKIKKN